MSAHISFKQLHVFNAIIEHKTLTAVAQKLFISKAAVSLSLAELERQLGHPLFDRVNNRLILNQEGKKLLPLADELINRLQHINHIFEQEQGLSGVLRVGSSDTIGNHITPSILSGFRQVVTQQTQRLFISNSAHICQKIIDYEVDIGLIEGKPHHPDIIATPFSGDNMCIICAPSHPFATKKQVTLAELENSDWVLREHGSGSRASFIQNLAPHLKQWHQCVELNTTEALINSVAAGLGFGCLSSIAAQYAIRSQRVCKINITVDISREFWILTHKDKYQSPLLSSFIDHCKKWGNENRHLR
ncbi:LysR family transcriptional regulator [Shewanella intestini]|uniref:LysR family transcriptional regulator n=1 Tax=Shewanella intestini TaxID=2017544 RepID=A0ABS5I333_9GAMM|nr:MULTISPECIES: LysR family transcriptional regulator [Shewanella]MBR9728426.1 LysR family transcriptional regulator [Shewanella intestini]MRG36768.1 LysR family transcriptional regulator [Shewanella sp. XMDDZSB0408]